MAEWGEKRSLPSVNEHFFDHFNTALATQVALIAVNYRGVRP